MKHWFRCTLLLISLAGSTTPVAAQSKPIDYQSLDFTLTLGTLRAGNHDSSGVNEYFFEVKLYGLPIIKEDLRKPLADRKKSELYAGIFAETTLESLKYWVADKKPTGITLTVTGDQLRSLVAETMRTYTVAEEKTSLLAVVRMLERNKKFKYIGEDTVVGEASFDIIPDSLPHGPRVANRLLTIRDAQGTYVELKLEYDSLGHAPPVAAPSAQAAAGANPGLTKP